MNRVRSMWLATILAALSAPLHAASRDAPAPPPIVGTWLLESIVDTLKDGSRAYWMGLRPNEVGVVYRRAIRIEGDRLFISLAAELDGVPRQRELTWRRAP